MIDNATRRIIRKVDRNNFCVRLDGAAQPIKVERPMVRWVERDTRHFADAQRYAFCRLIVRSDGNCVVIRAEKYSHGSINAFLGAGETQHIPRAYPFVGPSDFLAQLRSSPRLSVGETNTAECRSISIARKR